MSTSGLPISELNRIDEGEEDKEAIYSEIRHAVDEIQSRQATVPVADSFTELRGILEGSTDEEGRSGTEILREEREREKRKDERTSRHR